MVLASSCASSASSARPRAARGGALGVVLVVLVALTPGPARADGAVGRVLTPASGDRLGAAFARMKPRLSLKDARIERDRVRATLCAPGGTPCHRIELVDPSSGCEGTIAGAFCVRYLEGAGGARPDGAARSVIEEALAAIAEGDAWAVPVHPRADGPAAAPWWRAALIALALCVAPLAAGAALGRALRAIAPTSLATPGRRVALGLALVVSTIAVAVSGLGLGLWDASLVALLALAGALVRRPRWEEAALAIAATGLALAIGEVAARRLLPPPPSLPVAESARLTIARADGDRAPDLNNAENLGWPQYEACAALYPATWPALFRSRTSRPAPRARRVIHFGDSMVEGFGVAEEEAFPHLLEAADATTTHVNAGVKNTTVDFHYLEAGRWLDRLPADLVVVHLFTGSDIDEMDGAFPCCRHGALLDYDGDRAIDRCPAPDFAREPLALGWLVRHSPPPYPLRAAARASRLAAVLAAAWHARATRAEPRPIQWAHFRDVLVSLRDELARRRVPLLVTILPSLRALELVDPSRSDAWQARQGMVALCRELGLDCLDAWDLYAELVAREGAARFFLPDRLHFTPEGHARLAALLRPRIAFLLAHGDSGAHAAPR